MREKRTTNCFSRWRGINAFIRHPKTGRGLTLRRAQDVIEWNGTRSDPLWREKELGEFLRCRRESGGMTFKDVVYETNLQRRYIKAIEGGDFSELPGGLFKITFVRMYARAVGVSDKELDGFYHDAVRETASESPQTPRDTNNEAYESERVKPPRFAEFLLYLFLTKSERINLIGDTEEEFNEVLEKFGRRKANAWFYKQVFDSLRPLVRRSITKLWIAIWLARNADRIADFLQRHLR